VLPAVSGCAAQGKGGPRRPTGGPPGGERPASCSLRSGRLPRTPPPCYRQPSPPGGHHWHARQVAAPLTT